VLTFAVVDLYLAFWGAGWWHRCGASLVALIGAVLLVRGVAALVAPHWTELARRDSRSRRTAPIATTGAVVAELARR
jgi:predicted phage tail protein